MRDHLDDAFHSPARLQVAAFLSGCDEAAFGTVLESCGLTKSTLSKSVRALEDARYVAVRKGYHGRMPRTWLSLTPKGRKALAAHLNALRRLADDAVSASRAEASAATR
ncbi:MAG TPA: transcriptional regulator [Thermoleophilaceae bacterium]|jgi:DNA-binding MarR family transcriptional regulator